jgi:hypothetical protein
MLFRRAPDTYLTRRHGGAGTPMTINKNKLHAALCIVASATASLSFIAWALGKLS